MASVVCTPGVRLRVLINSISDYRRAITGSAGQLLLRDCLGKVHEDIITCWNFKGEVLNCRYFFRLYWLDLCSHYQILNSPEFQQLMLRLVQDVHTQPNVSMCVLTHSLLPDGF